MYTPWVLLDFQDARRFAVRHDFSANSYAIQVTDFKSVWTEQLDRRRVIGRALDEDTAIDPSEDSAQLSLLLQYIRGTLEPRRRGARLEVHMQTQQKLHIEGINVLPKPLRDLKWPFRLSQTNDSTLATELIAPLISQGYVQHQHIERLVRELEQKDAAIDKVLEKLEGTGVELASVFPTLASHRGGRHVVTREQVLQQVQGLKPFDAQSWQDLKTDDMSTTQSLAVILDGAMAGTADSTMQRLVTLVARKIKTGLSGEQEDFDGDTTMTEPQKAAAAAESSYIADSFQRQQTPLPLTRRSEVDAEAAASRTPHKQSREVETDSPMKEKPLASLSRSLSYRGKDQKAPPAVPDDDETTDDEDLDAPYTSAPRTPAKSTSPIISKDALPKSPGLEQYKAKLGGLQGRQNLQPEASQDKQHGQQSSHPQGTHKEHASSPRISPPPSKPASRPRLGRLGGAARQQPPESASQRQQPQEQQEAEQSSRNKDKGRMKSNEQDEAASEKAGNTEVMSGSSSSPSAPPPQDQQDQRGRLAQTSGQPSARETSGERADRKREELKRQLAEQQQAQAAGGGKQARKRRRF